MKKLVIAEKPSVGREIGKALNAFNREQGYIEGNEYIVTWALGHLVELSEPASYSEEYKRWTLSSLPMLPEELTQSVIQESKEQFEVVSSLLNRKDIESVIIATDAGREGELVARWILKLAGWKGKTERLWISSQTEKAIKEGFSALKPASDYDNLFCAAECRAAADWYVGMNVTRALTCFYDAKLSAGRVQTPTLALMTEREDEIDSFVGEYYYTARGNFGLFSASYYPEENSIRFKDDERAKTLEGLKHRKGKVVSIRKEEKSEPVPLAYDLTELQRDANLSLGFSAKETLDVLQRLYEVHKIVTYPRTDSRYITEDIVPTIPERLRAIRDTVFSYQVDEYLENGFNANNPRFVNSALVSDHHAIIPTEQKVRLSDLNEKEEKLWRLIALRFLEVLGEDYRYVSTQVNIDVEGFSFMTRSVEPLKLGYRSASVSARIKSASPVSEEGGDGILLSSLQEGSELDLISVRVRKTSTTPPERYTDATLLSAMEHAGRFVENEEAKTNLTNGLGTPATRADMIEKLIQNKYVEREGKYLKATEKGREVVRLAPSVLKSPELTGVWEGRLEKISKGKENPEKFIHDIKSLASALVSDVKTSREKFSPIFKEGKTCPYCDGPMMKAIESDGAVHYICQRMSCSYEEKEVKVRVGVPEEARKRITTDENGKVRVVINKNALRIPKAVYETKTEVVRESKRKYKAGKPSSSSYREKHSYISREKPYFSSGSDSGGTMADFFRLSKEREEKRKNRR